MIVTYASTDMMRVEVRLRVRLCQSVIIYSFSSLPILNGGKLIGQIKFTEQSKYAEDSYLGGCPGRGVLAADSDCWSSYPNKSGGRLCPAARPELRGVLHRHRIERWDHSSRNPGHRQSLRQLHNKYNPAFPLPLLRPDLYLGQRQLQWEPAISQQQFIGRESLPA
jgi:hypothetical protein